MKKLCSLILLAGCAVNASADIHSFDFNNGFQNAGLIPDGNTAGWFDTRTLSGIANPEITDVNVSLNFSGGYSGDFYAYLAHGSGFSVLLNRVGRATGNSSGYGDAGLNLVFDDNASNGDIHSYQTV